MLGHSGREHVLSKIRTLYWIVGARTSVRRVLRDCVKCKRRAARPSHQRMADLPQDRVTPGEPPFSHVRVDCFGPFITKRGRSEVKPYGCVFTCLAIRAIHIEVLFSLDTDSFMNALRRFISRRGRPISMRSDNGTNFVGADKELKKAVASWNQDRLNKFFSNNDITWKFNPPLALHMGGIWERMVQSIKRVLSGLTREQALDDESLSTLMCEAEAIVNSRPLTTVSDDVKDPEPLTPNHLLTLRSGPTVPPGIFVKEDVYSRKRWKQVQYMADVFWRRWTREYLPTLRQRPKWREPQRNFKVDDVVLLVEETPRNLWQLGRILEVFTGKDEHVRSVKVKTQTTTLIRPVTKICLLESLK